MPGPRRHQRDGARVRDAERTRTRLLEAARTHFAEKGYAGARVEAIAATAGVNKQLIAYYFGGKQGLYQAVVERRKALVAGFDTPETPLPELARCYVQAFGAHPDLERIFLRDVLDRDPESASFDADASEVVDLRRRQEAGEIRPGIDPGFLLLFLQAMTVSGTLFAAEAKRLTGLDPRSEEFRDRAADQVSRIVESLG